MKLGFIGMGNMGQALCEGWLKAGALTPENVFAYAPHPEKLKKSADRIGFQPADSLSTLVKASERILMACKPYQVESVLAEIAPLLPGKVLLSVALGWDLKRYQAALGPEQAVQFIMPNTPARVGEGVFLFEEESTLSAEELAEAKALFAALGQVIVLPSRLMGIGGAVSGCGPAFVDLMMEAFADAAVKYGIPRDLAYPLVSQTFLGSAKLQRDTGIHPAALKDAVCSPGGSTIRGVLALEEKGARAACQAAIDAVMQYK
ncbi:MAG: pyrroline-5-carboxylate reductase [Lachnospiraceae bacterium]|nr:pyrroline-5-carboxylate reductase [Lachnospiraceae bacterium]